MSSHTIYVFACSSFRRMSALSLRRRAAWVPDSLSPTATPMEGSPLYYGRLGFEHSIKNGIEIHYRIGHHPTRSKSSD